MIEWIKYDRNSREIESHVYHLATDGMRILKAQHAKRLDGDGYCWYEGNSPITNITHWSEMNLPKAFNSTESPSNEVAEADVYGKDCRNGSCS